jgi:hypothetical protein
LQTAISPNCAFTAAVTAVIRWSVLSPLFGQGSPLLVLGTSSLRHWAQTTIASKNLAPRCRIVGNLISNTLICIVGLSISIYVAIAALIFLVVIHKLEYFLNAEIIGARIRSRAWELLLAMILLPYWA